MLGSFFGGLPFGGMSASPAGMFGSQLGMLQQQMQQQELARRMLIEQVLYPRTVRVVNHRNDTEVEVPRREGWCSLCREHHLTHCEWDVIEALAKLREEEDAVAKVQETIDEWLQTEEGKRWREEQG